MSPVEAAAQAIDIHNTAGRWNKALLDNSARPSGALVYGGADGRMTAEQFARLKAELEDGFQGPRRAGRPLLLEGGLDWKPLSLSPKDMDFIAARNGAAREIALAFGVPPMLLGIPGDNTYSNYQEAQRAFWRATVLPLVVRTSRALSSWLAPAWELADTAPLGPAVDLRPDVDQIEALTSEREALWARIEKVSFLTLNEKRAAVGYAPLEEAEAAAVATDGDMPVVVEKYNPNQPRVPAGVSEGGQWVDAGGGLGTSVASGVGAPAKDEGPRDEHVRVAQAGDAKYTVNLHEEEARGGHTIKHHAGKTDIELRARLDARTVRMPSVTIYYQRESSFESIESANNFINRILEKNVNIVDMVVSGDLTEKWISERFGHPTGREAYRNMSNHEVTVRKAYSAGVLIRTDKNSPRGFRVETAYPFNEDPN